MAVLRKTVTVVFCDVTGSTPLGRAARSGGLQRVMARYFEVTHAVLERHGGTVEKFIGDAVMAVFGIPAVHEDDALRAVRAAAEMRDGARRALNDELERDWDVDSSPHRREHAAKSSRATLRAARRLCTGRRRQRRGAAGRRPRPGEILIGEATKRARREARSRSSRSSRWS